ncbi:uncharacterized protein LOC100205776 isoform X2 [Hydra vulgaris]|uniref:Uncharacterized protein LOC100205776 isoform X2 n=1 Tax=Hydra vulgaris TaxID=6087 RepID=A0ABM4BR60_HYDVU
MVSENEFIAIKDEMICPKDFDKIDSKSNTPEDVVVDTLNCVSNVQLVQNNNGLSLTLKKTSMDITKTRQYKEIYADNLRQYSFLLSKQLGISNQSNNELRRQYLQSRQRESERRSLQCKNEEKKGSPEAYKKSTLHLPLVSLRYSNRDFRKSSCPNLLSPVNEEQFNTNKHKESSESKSANSSPILSKKCSIDSNDCQNNEHQHKQMITAINHRSKTATKKYIQREFTQPSIPFSLRRSNENIGNNQAHSLTNLALPLSEMELNEQLGISNQSNNALCRQYLQSRQRESERRSLQCKNEEKKGSPEAYKKSTLHLPLVSLRYSNRDFRKSSCPNLLSPVNEEQFNTNKHEESSESKSANSSPILSKKCSIDSNDCQNNEHQHKQMTTAINHRSKTATKKYIQREFTQPSIPFSLKRSNKNIGNYQARSLTNLALPLSEMELNENQLDISNLLNSELCKEYLQSKLKEIEENDISPDYKKTSPRLYLIHKEKYCSLRKCSCPNLQSQFDEKHLFHVECDNLSQSKSEGSSPQLSKKLTSSLINIPDFHKQEDQCKSITNTISHQSRDKNNKYPQQELTQPDDAIALKRYMESFGNYRSYSLTNLSSLIYEKKIQEYNSKILPNYSSQRQREAEQRYHWRLSRLDSFEGMLAKVNLYINKERRSSNPDLN